MKCQKCGTIFPIKNNIAIKLVTHIEVSVCPNCGNEQPRKKKGNKK